MHEKRAGHLPRLSVVLGVGATLLFITAYAAMRLLLGGEEDWNYGIFLVLCLMGALGISFIGIIVSLIAFSRVPGKRAAASLGLALNLIPGMTWFALWGSLQIHLR